MNRSIRSYVKFTGEEMAKEFANTMQIVREEFKTLDGKVLEVIKNKGEKEVGVILVELVDILDPFVDNMEEMINSRAIELRAEKRPIFVSEMTKIVANNSDGFEKFELIDILMGITMQSFDTYFELCMEYVCDRVSALMDAIEETLGIREEIKELEEFLNEKEIGKVELKELVEVLEMLLKKAGN